MCSSLSLYLSAVCVLDSHLNVTTDTAGAFSFTLAVLTGDGLFTPAPPLTLVECGLGSETPANSWTIVYLYMYELEAKIKDFTLIKKAKSISCLKEHVKQTVPVLLY